MHRKFTGENFFSELGRFNHTQRTALPNSKIYIYIYAAFTSYSMKRVSKFHSVPCILTLAQQLYSVIHRGYRQAFDDIALSSIFVQQYVVNGNKSSGRAIIQISIRYIYIYHEDERIKKRDFSRMMGGLE